MQYCTQIRVTNDGAITCVQEAFGITDGNTTRNCLVRRILYGSSRIYNWQWVNPPFVQGTVYETVEKYDGKVVYKKKLADGIYWSIDDGATWKPEAIYVGTLPISGGTMTGSLTLKDDPVDDLEAATKQYVDNHTVSAMVYEELPAKPSAPIADGQEIPYTWEQINAITLAGKAQEYFSLGATKLVNLSTVVLGANAATMMVIGFNQDGENTTTFQTKGVLPTITAFGSSAVWIDSTVRTQCQNFYNACEAKSFIKTVSKGTCPNYVPAKNGTATYNDEAVWIPSETEMGLDKYSSLTKSNSTTSNSECTKGYNAGYNYYTSNATRVKYQMSANGTLTTTTKWYWGRSRTCNNSNGVCYVYNDGGATYTGYTSSGGLAPAFVIGNSDAPSPSAKITQDGEDITDKVKGLVGGDGSKVGDIKVTTRTDLGNAWALCNGAAVPSNATELSALIPQNEYPLSTFDVLNLASTGEVYDIYNAADGNLYVISTRYNSDNQQRQYLSQISPSEGVLREIELTSIVAASSVFVDDSKIYLFGMPVTKKTESFPIVAYGNFSGGDFPTGWSTVEIQFPTNTYLPLNTYSVGSMGREGIFRIVGGKYYYMVYCYNSGKNGFAQPFMVSDTLGGQCTILTTGSLNAATLFVDSEDYIYLAGNSGSTLRLEVIKDGVVIKTGLTRSVYELSGCVWFVVSGNITYCYAYSPGSGVLLSLTYEKNSSSDMVARSQSGTRSTPIIQWGDKVYSYDVASSGRYDLYQLTDLPLGTFTTTNQSATAANLPALLSGMATREGDYYISLQSSGVTNGSVLKLIVPKSLPTITFDGAYAYIKVKE